MSIPVECKRLAEVDFPIAAVSKHAASEKSGPPGHPSKLHLWWARRPLAACRAMLLALLLPDPSDEQCPGGFKAKARELLARVPGPMGPNDPDLRQALLRFIGDFSCWDLAADGTYLDVARGLVRAAHPEEPPLVMDPFAGGGAIPLEAARVGCESFASDLNPVACLILKQSLESIPRRGSHCEGEYRAAAATLEARAREELSAFFPEEQSGHRPMAYIWARVAVCESPGCGSEIPLVRSFWLSNKAKQKWAMRLVVVRPPGGTPTISAEVFRPARASEVAEPTVSRARAVCPACGSTLHPDRVRDQLVRVRGGADVALDESGRRIGGAVLLAVVSQAPDGSRHYRPAREQDYLAIGGARSALNRVATVSGGMPAVPTEKLPLMSGTFNIPIYGTDTWGGLFNVRQQLVMVTLTRLIRELECEEEVRALLALGMGKLARHCNVVAKWHRGSQTVAGAFGMQALPMSWDFPELYPFAPYAGALTDSLADVAAPIAHLTRSVAQPAEVHQADACDCPLPDQSCDVWFTDPPYYFAIPYADLSDFFFVWLKRALPRHPLLADPWDSSNPLTPKARELCEMARWDATRYAHKNQQFFEEGMARAFAEGRRVLAEKGIGCVVFAHKTTEGWEALLSGLTRSGWTVTGSWPIATERSARLRARESAALATSVHLVCRPRSTNDAGDWTAVYRELPKRVGQWMERLESEGVRGADLVFACIGPALEIYSRYARVEDAEGREIPLGGDPEAKEPHKRGFLAYIWEVVGRTALEQVLGEAESRARNGAAAALEEDARLTALFLWTLQSTNGAAADEEPGDEGEADESDEDAPAKKKPGLSLPYDVARRFAQPLGIHLDDWEGRTIEIVKGVVRLLPVSERAKQLFGDDGAHAVAAQLERSPAGRAQMVLFPDQEDAPKVKGRGRGRPQPGADVSDEALGGRREATTLDRVHAAMLLQKAGRTNALRALLATEQQRGPDFMRLANALVALYPKDYEEKRLLEAMLLAAPR